MQGWKWQDEGKHGRHKWGWVSWEPGARLVIKVAAARHRGLQCLAQQLKDTLSVASQLDT